MLGRNGEGRIDGYWSVIREGDDWEIRMTMLTYPSTGRAGRNEVDEKG